MLLHPLSLPVLCIILICALLTVLQLFSCENSQLPGFGLFFQEKQTELPVFWVVFFLNSDQLFKCIPIFYYANSYRWIHVLTCPEQEKID